MDNIDLYKYRKLLKIWFYMHKHFLWMCYFIVCGIIWVGTGLLLVMTYYRCKCTHNEKMNALVRITTLEEERRRRSALREKLRKAMFMSRSSSISDCSSARSSSTFRPPQIYTALQDTPPKPPKKKRFKVKWPEFEYPEWQSVRYLPKNYRDIYKPHPGTQGIAEGFLPPVKRATRYYVIRDDSNKPAPKETLKKHTLRTYTARPPSASTGSNVKSSTRGSSRQSHGTHKSSKEQDSSSKRHSPIYQIPKSAKQDFSKPGSSKEPVRRAVPVEKYIPVHRTSNQRAIAQEYFIQGSSRKNARQNSAQASADKYYPVHRTTKQQTLTQEFLNNQNVKATPGTSKQHNLKQTSVKKQTKELTRRQKIKAAKKQIALEKAQRKQSKKWNRRIKPKVIKEKPKPPIMMKPPKKKQKMFYHVIIKTTLSKSFGMIH